MTLVRAVFGLVALVAFVLGVIGMAKFRDPAEPLDVVYFVLQLFVLGSDPLEDGGPYPWQLELARFLAPLITVLTVVEAGRLLLADEVRRLRSRAARGHVVVCGDTTFARILAEQLFATGHHVVVVRSRPIGPLEMRHRRMLGVMGDARVPAVLRAAGIRQVRHVYICGDDDQTNHAVAVAVSTELQLRKVPPWIYVQLNRQGTCHALQARRMGTAGSNRFRLDYFHVDDVAARVLYRRHPLEPAPDRPTRLLIVGDGSFARVLLVESARYWRSLGNTPDRLEIDVVGSAARRTVLTLANRFPFLNRACRIEARDEALETWLPRISRSRRYDRIYLCHDDEQWMIDLALTSLELWRAAREAVFVATYQSTALADAFHGGVHNDLLDEVNGRLQVYPIITRACNARLISEDLSERLARAIHQRYLDAGAPGSAASAKDWDHLGESLRDANRAQVQGIAAKARMIGCVIAPRDGSGETISTGEVESLAILEHDRWCAERTAHGWRHGPARDDRRRHHPDLVGWATLTEDSREKARETVRRMSEMLADEGFAIVRLDDPVGSDVLPGRA